MKVHGVFVNSSMVALCSFDVVVVLLDSKLYGVDATITKFVFVLYCISVLLVLVST